MKDPRVYILADKPRGSLYTGVTSEPKKRVFEHKSKLFSGFTAKHDIDKLVWFEGHDSMESAIHRKKALKRWRREWKLQLIELRNPDWKDLYAAI